MSFPRKHHSGLRVEAGSHGDMVTALLTYAADGTFDDLIATDYDRPVSYDQVVADYYSAASDADKRAFKRLRIQSAADAQRVIDRQRAEAHARAGNTSHIEADIADVCGRRQ